MEKKVCTKCKVEKDLSEFYLRKSRMRIDAQCKVCVQNTNKEWKEKNQNKIKEWKEKNKGKLGLYYLEYRQNNKEKLKKLDKDRYERKKEYILENAKYYYISNKKRIKEYRQNNKEKIQEYRRGYNRYYRNKRYQEDLIFKLRHKIKSSINRQLKDKGYTKKSRTYKILGCSFEEFKKYIESKFESWMSWENHGLYNGEEQYGWDIDHIIPASSAVTEEDVINLNHYLNLQPLCSKINRVIKNGKLNFNQKHDPFL